MIKKSLILFAALFMLTSCGSNKPLGTEETTSTIPAVEDISTAETESFVDVPETFATAQPGLGDADNISDAEAELVRKANRLSKYIPDVYITTNGGKAVTSKKRYVSGLFSMSVPKDSEYEKVSAVTMNIKGRGNSTWTWAKKPYRVEFSEKISLFGLPEARDYALLANYADRSLLRNVIAYDSAKETNLSFVPTAIPVSLYLNGKYQGVYTLGDLVEVKSGRIDFYDKGGDNELDVGYLLEVGGADNERHIYEKEWFDTENLKHILVHSPRYGDNLTEAQYDYIKNYIIETENAVVNLDGYERYIDVDSFVDFFLHTELFYNLDSTYYRSCYFRKDPGGKLKMATIWDYDMAIGNYSGDWDYTAKSFNYNRFADVHGDDTYVKTKSWAQYLLKDSKFCAKVKARWAELGDKMLNRSLDTAEKYRVLLAEPAKKNFELWNILGNGQKAGLEANTINIPTYDGQIDYVENFLKNRKNWLDGAIENLPLE